MAGDKEMNKTQQSACYGILLSLLLAGIVVFDLIDARAGWPTKLLVALAWGGFLLVPLYLIGRKKYPREVTMDERDKRIVRRALLISFVLLAAALGAAFVVALFTRGIQGTIALTMNDLSAVIYAAMIAFILVLSVAVLVQCGRARNGEAS